MSLANLEAILEKICIQAQQYEACGMRRPVWLEKKIAAVHILADNPTRGLIVMADGMQDELAALMDAKYNHYAPGETHGTSPDL